jgi:Skp family chaperone for outer membrane proteins
MGRIERIVVHGVLVVLLLVVFAERPGLTPAAQAVPARAEDVVGPADRLVLRGPEGDVSVSAVDGGLSWGERSTDRSWTLGAVNVPKIMRSLMESERFDEDRRALREEADAQNAEFEEQFEAFREEYGEIKPDDPKFPEAQQRWQAMMQEYQKWQQGTMAIQQKLGAEQIETAFRELVDAVDIVAERLGVDLVIRFVPASEPFEAESIDQASDQISRRLLLHHPDAIDLTEKVGEELGV